MHMCIFVYVYTFFCMYYLGPPMSQRQSQQPGGTPQRNANENSNRAQTNTTATQQGSISANPFAALFSQLLGGASAPVSGQSSGGRMVSEPGAGVAGLAAAMTSMLNREVSKLVPEYIYKLLMGVICNSCLNYSK